MAAIEQPTTPTEQIERSIIEMLCSLSTAEQDANRLAPEQTFDLGCALAGAREALERALAIAAQTQPQAQPLRMAA
jgi:hypothetical protein